MDRVQNKVNLQDHYLVDMQGLWGSQKGHFSGSLPFPIVPRPLFQGRRSTFWSGGGALDEG